MNESVRFALPRGGLAVAPCAARLALTQRLMFGLFERTEARPGIGFIAALRWSQISHGAPLSSRLGGRCCAPGGGHEG